MTIINKILNDESNNYATRKIKLLSIDDISINPLNRAPINNIEDLQDTISELGLQTPLTVYKRENNDYVIINGERRFNAIMKLGWEEVPVLIIDKPSSLLEEKLLILDANAQRELTQEHKVLRAKEYEEVYLELKQLDKEQIRGIAKRDWIAKHMNISGRQVSNLLAEDIEQNNDDDEVAVTKKAQKEKPDLSKFEEVEEYLSYCLETKVKFTQNKFTISFDDDEELERILKAINHDYEISK